MVRHPERLAAFERRWLASTPHDPQQNLVIYEAMWQLAVASGVLPGDDPLEGIARDIELAKDLRVSGPPRANR